MSAARALRDAPWLRSGAGARVLALLNGDGEEARVIGGAVRNALLRIPIGDVDIATTALPDEVIRRAKAAGIKSVPTGIEHGTVTLVVDGHPFEVTTLREDVETFGRKAKVAFGRDWVRDASAAISPSTACRSTPTAWCTTTSAALPISPRARALHRRSRPAHRRGLPAHPAVLPHPRRLWLGRAGSRRLSRLHSRPRRPRHVSAERVRMEMLKLVVAAGARRRRHRDGGWRAAAADVWRRRLSRAVRGDDRRGARLAKRPTPCSGSARWRWR